MEVFLHWAFEAATLLYYPVYSLLAHTVQAAQEVGVSELLHALHSAHMQWREGLASHSLLTGPTGSLDLEQVFQGYQCQLPSVNLHVI